MSEWVIPNKDEIISIRKNNDGPDPIDVYKDRYINHPPDVSPKETIDRIWNEAFIHFQPESSVLLFGSGHSYWANEFRKFPNVSKISVLDYVEEAGFGLDSEIDFYCDDILTTGITGKYDYIYSAHTVEHFSREDVLFQVLPKCLAAAKKAVIFVVPYGTNWADEPCHKCLFYEDDELCALASRYKIIRNGIELVLWFGEC